MTDEELIVVVRDEIKGLSSQFDGDDFNNALATAKRDTGFTLPSTVDFNLQWLINRTKRALFFSLLSESAHKFKFKQVNLQDRFAHYRLLIRDLDREFRKAQAEYAHLFAGVSSTQLFGHKVDAGFAYDDFGKDRTYASDQKVVINPTDND